eukprot:NODE_4287_length_1193_cov_46.151402_g3783_i0.p1 GENE.NODE_4287_length_1193_cov_46.151402_g3783_i0~~NODE_4287_length_1193_cov_46.151402_g3783_i0.p1  ORF type:complete len:364 (-),score=77.82 NODE_4287_length_1193_cov_46.151402_g3783_i0:100-1134(-)
MEDMSINDRSVGSILGVALSDALGAAVEGWDPERIKSIFPNGVRHFVPCTHMGERQSGIRYGMYTDDTNATLALAESLVECQNLNAQSVATKCSEFALNHEPHRGCPDSAKAVYKEILKGEPLHKTARLLFPDGSFANGGAMRASPLGIVYRHASPNIVKLACEVALAGTHVHPEAVDGALIIVLAIQYALRVNPSTFNSRDFIKYCVEGCSTSIMKTRLTAVFDAYQDNLGPNVCDYDNQVMDSLGCIGFQIKSIEALPLVIWCVARWYNEPENCIINTIEFGGDTDTTASMVGGIIGSLHGTKWIPVRWLDNFEDGQYGKSYILDLGQKLALLDLQSVDPLS